MPEQQPEQQQPGSRLGDSVMVVLIEHTERIAEAMAETQRVLTERIKELGQVQAWAVQAWAVQAWAVQAWAVQAPVDLQKRAYAAIKSLERPNGRGFREPR